MGEVDVSKYNCDSSALESLPLDKDFNDNFTASQKGGARRNRSQRRSRQQRRQSQRRQSQRRSRQQRRQSQRRSRQQRRSRKQRRGRKQRGGHGYFLDVGAERIGGLTKVVGYNSQPALINGEMVKNAADEKMCGGGKRRVNHLRSDNTGRRNKQVRRRNTRKNLKERVCYRKIGGGKEQESVYTDDMNQREFGCRQPEWNAKCI